MHKAMQVASRIALSRVTRRLEKNCQFLSKIAQKVVKSKRPKIFTTKLNLKAQIIYNKTLLNLKSSPMGEKSPNLVTLALSYKHRDLYKIGYRRGRRNIDAKSFVSLLQ